MIMRIGKTAFNTPSTTAQPTPIIVKFLGGKAHFGGNKDNILEKKMLKTSVKRLPLLQYSLDSSPEFHIRNQITLKEIKTVMQVYYLYT